MKTLWFRVFATKYALGCKYATCAEVDVNIFQQVWILVLLYLHAVQQFDVCFDSIIDFSNLYELVSRVRA